MRSQWLTLEAPPLAPAVAEIRARCEEAGLVAPSYGAIERRIPSLFSPEELARKRSANPKHLLRLKPRPGYIRASKALEVCQIDHTPTDINFVEVVEDEGVFVGRAYLTLVADVATRCILGFCLTLEKPSALSVALCLAQAMCPKEDWLAARGIKYSWPMFGRPRRLVTDSAKEFKGHAFQSGCDDYGIRIRYRNRGCRNRQWLSRSSVKQHQITSMFDSRQNAVNINQSLTITVQHAALILSIRLRK